jgi:hypothetical protein
MSTPLSPRRSGLVVAYLVLAAALLVSATNAWAGEITYDIINDPAIQGGYNLSGTITTDGVLGYLGSSDITSWNWTATNGVNEFSANSTDTNANVVIANHPNVLFATSEGLTACYATPENNVNNGFGLAAADSGLDQFVVWACHTDSAFFSIQYNEGNGQQFPVWSDFQPVPNPVPLGWEFANNGTATPEPATLTLLGSALLGLGVVYLRRRGAKA